MRIRLPFALAASLLLALPVFASTANSGAPAHRRHTHFARPRASSCGQVAGHASHTFLAAPAAVPCHTGAAPVAGISTTAAPVARIHTRPAVLTTQPATTHAAITPLRRVRFVPPMRGSLESLMRQNQRDEAEGLVRIEDDVQLDQLEASRDIVPVPASYSLRVNPDLPANRRYCRPWTAHFLADLARSHYARFHHALQVNSAVRTVQFQRALLQVNGNAAPADGDIASPHLTGAAVDIGKKGMSFSELSWMRAWLLPLQTTGRIDVEEEFYQSCFHITVYRGYAPPTPLRTAPPRIIAHRRRNSTTLLAAGVH
ncbi:MAG: DUF5715 family protein [Acidobacteriaceae bacterium]